MSVHMVDNSPLEVGKGGGEINDAYFHVRNEMPNPKKKQ